MNILKIKIVVILLGVFALQSCDKKTVKFPQANIADLQVNELEIHRYGQALFELDTNDFKNGLKTIRDEFGYFLAADLDDPDNISQLYEYVTDTQLVSIYRKTEEVFPNLNKLENEFGGAFSRYHHYFPDKVVPEIYTYISDMYYELPVRSIDSVLIIALDVYLGGDFFLYRQLGLPMFKIRNMAPEYITTDVMRTMYHGELSPVYKRKTLLDRMIDEGKMLAYLDAVLPMVSDSIKIKYTAHQLNWANNNEKDVWAFLVGNELLYETDYQMQTKLLQDGPFTTGFGNNSPPRLGAYIGWQIVLAYLNQNPDVSLLQIIKETDSQRILHESRYKP